MISTERRQRCRKNRRRGQSLVEFALALPFLMLVTVSIIYFGKLFLIKQAVMLACQQGARALGRTPGIYNPAMSSQVVGFTTDGQLINTNSVVAGALGAANLLSEGYTGNLPPGSSVQVLLPPGGNGLYVPPGTVALQIDYPFQFTGNPFAGAGGGSKNFGSSFNIWTGPGASPLSFMDFTIKEKAVALQEVYESGSP